MKICSYYFFHIIRSICTISLMPAQYYSSYFPRPFLTHLDNILIYQWSFVLCATFQSLFPVLPILTDRYVQVCNFSYLDNAKNEFITAIMKLPTCIKMFNFWIFIFCFFHFSRLKVKRQKSYKNPTKKVYSYRNPWQKLYADDYSSGFPKK